MTEKTHTTQHVDDAPCIIRDDVRLAPVDAPVDADLWASDPQLAARLAFAQVRAHWVRQAAGTTMHVPNVEGIDCRTSSEIVTVDVDVDPYGETAYSKPVTSGTTPTAAAYSKPVTSVTTRVEGGVV